jgi:hypothetical protein
MRTCRLSVMIAIALVLASIGGSAGLSASPMSLKRDGSIEIGGRTLRCGPVRLMLARRLANLGVAGPGMIALNPGLLSRYPETVRLFVFYHECGHHHVGASELGADCWAVNRGVREGWLDENGLGQVCRTFGNAPETSTHPSGKRRCSNVNRCFASAVAALPRQQDAPATSRASAVPGAADKPPQPLAPPALVRTGRSLSADPVAADKHHKGQGFSAAQQGERCSAPLCNRHSNRRQDHQGRDQHAPGHGLAENQPAEHDRHHRVDIGVGCDAFGRAGVQQEDVSAERQ